MKIYNNHVNKLTIKINSYISVILNLFSLIFGIIYLINSVYSLLYDVFGVILLITFFENILLVYLNSIGINKTSELGHKIYSFCYIYLIFIILAMMGMMGGNLLIASIYNSNLINNLCAYIMIIFFYFGLLIAGIYIAIIDIKHYNNDTIWNLNEFFHRIESKRNLKIKKILRRFLIISCWIIYSIGISFAIVIIFGSFEILTTFFAIVSGQFGIFFSFIFLSNTVLLLNLKKRKWSSKKYLRMGIIGIFVSGSLMMHLFLTNYTIYNAEKSFTETFGNEWRDEIPSSVNNYFLESPFSLPSYFLGIPPKPCKIDKNILFYNDEGITLYFDVYMPMNNGIGLPGENSTIIRIHGGGWVSGDKGFMNMMQMNKYFAAQGYIVFDIQYGIDDNPLFEMDPSTPDYKKGDFDIDDMMRHIGIFTYYLANHSDDYGANLDSVFISGGSAGGHLTCAVALAISSGNYTSIFSNSLTIRGLIPFYPANGQMIYFGIDGSEEFKNPERLIENESPPCLIFQGTHDILNYFSISENIKKTYLDKGNHRCAILWMPLGGHGCDFYFPGYYNQIFLYYMERFIYLYH